MIYEKNPTTLIEGQYTLEELKKFEAENDLILPRKTSEIFKVLPKSYMDEAHSAVSSWDNYSPTPLISERTSIP